MAKIKALLLGCGNIGAGYDLQNKDVVHTHAKAYTQIKNIELTVTDADLQKAREAAKHFKATVVELNAVDFKEYQIISIATPTQTHHHYLTQAIQSKTPVIICEKPVAGDLKELADLKKKYAKGKTRIVVNYMRRFIPGNGVLKNRIGKILKKEDLTSVTVHYNRGFLNNGTHAIDLLEFLLDTEFKFEKFSVKALLEGAYENDPTIVGTCRFKKVNVTFAGTTDSVFGVELVFQQSKIIIGDRGNTVQYFQRSKTKDFEENVRLRQTSLLTTYMKPVIAKALQLHRNRREKDNFLQALALNQRTAKLITKIRNS